MNESHVLEHTQCPECAKKGKDSGHDNLAIYSDGHHWCFRCGYLQRGNQIQAFKSRIDYSAKLPQPEWSGVRLPFDCDTGIPVHARQWLQSYGFSDATITKHTILWSESRQLLVFPYFIMGELVAWQGRYFGTEKKGKWYTNGDVDSFIYALGNTRSSRVVLVESVISAIKLSKTECCSPLFGSHISNRRLLRLAKMYKSVVIWLDPDKQRDAIIFARQARLFGLDCQVIMSDMKPKDYTQDEIEEYLK